MRVVIAEDSVLLREGLGQILARFGHEVAAAVDDAPGLAAAVAEHRPDIVVTDVRMPPGFRDEGLRAALALRAGRPGLPVLVLAQYVEQSYAADLLRTGGAVGYLLKDREREVLAMMAEGRSNGAIARALVVSEHAVVKHVGSIFIKLDLHQTPDDHRRVLAVLTHLRDSGG